MNTRKQFLDLDSVLPLATKRSLQEPPQHSKPSVYDVHGLQENPPAQGFSHWQCVEMPICLGGCPIAIHSRELIITATTIFGVTADEMVPREKKCKNWDTGPEHVPALMVI